MMIMRIGKGGTVPPARQVIDAHGCLLIPGAIDSHVHFRDPGQTHKEDFLSSTTAAAVGGVTTVMDMPNTTPPTVDEAIFKDKLDIASSKAIVDRVCYA
jgi:dihydroorotase